MLVELFGLRIFCTTDELYESVDRSATVSRVDSFFAAKLSPRLRSWAMMAFRLEAELFRLRDSRYVPLPFDFVEGVGLGGLLVDMLLTVAEMGILGGGMESCLTLCSALSPCSWPMLFLEALRFQDRLNFLLKELMDDGVGGSSGLESGGGDFVPADFMAIGFGARGPEGLC